MRDPKTPDQLRSEILYFTGLPTHIIEHDDFHRATEAPEGAFVQLPPDPHQIC